MRVLLWVLLFGSCFAGQRPYVLLLDAGHGGRDPGAIGYLGMKEKDLCLLFVRDLAVALKRYPDIKVVLTRKMDETLRLSRRLSIAKRLKPDLFLSLHMDKGDHNSYRGMSVYVPSRKTFRSLISRSNFWSKWFPMYSKLSSYDTVRFLRVLTNNAFFLSKHFAHDLLGVLSKQRVYLHNTEPIARELYLFHQYIPTVLVELGYISNADDVIFIQNAKNRKRLANKIAAVIESYFHHHLGSMESLA